MSEGESKQTKNHAENCYCDIGGKEAIDKFLDWIKTQRRYSVNTLDSYSRSVRHWCAWLNDNEFFSGDIRSVGKALAKNYLAYLSNSGKSRRSIHNRISALRSFYKFLIRESIAGKNPFETLKLPKLEKGLPVFLNVEQMPKLLSEPKQLEDDGKLSDREAMCDSLCLELLYGAGFRVSELCSLKWENIDFTNGVARITGKGAKVRFCPFGEQALKLLKLWRQSYAKDTSPKAYILTTPRGTPMYPRRIQRRLHEYLLRANLPINITPHKIRHSYATHLLNAGMDLRVLQELLGHASLSSTQIYTHLDMRQLKQTYLKAHPRA